MVGSIIAAIITAHMPVNGPNSAIGMDMSMFGSIQRMCSAIGPGRPMRSRSMPMLIVNISHHAHRMSAKNPSHSPLLTRPCTPRLPANRLLRNKCLTFNCLTNEN